MADIFSLRAIADYCKRQSGRTTGIVDICVEHLQSNSTTLVVVCVNEMLLEQLRNDIINSIGMDTLVNVTKRELRAKAWNGKQWGHASVMLTSNFNPTILRGRRIQDVIFDAPEATFFNYDNPKNRIDLHEYMHYLEP